MPRIEVDSQIDFYKILKILKKASQLNLFSSMKIHNNFRILLLRSIFIDSLTNQMLSWSFSIIVNEEEEDEMNDILNNRYHYNKLQYRVSWIEHSSNNVWYSAENFDHAKKIIENYHARYSTKSEFALRRNEAHTANVIIWINKISTLIEKELVKTRRFLNQTKKMTKDILMKMNEKYQAKNQEKNYLIKRIAFINTFDRS